MSYLKLQVSEQGAYVGNEKFNLCETNLPWNCLSLKHCLSSFYILKQELYIFTFIYVYHLELAFEVPSL